MNGTPDARSTASVPTCSPAMRMGERSPFKMLVYASCFTPARFAASMTAVCSATRWPKFVPEMSSTRSTPASAASRVSGRL